MNARRGGKGESSRGTIARMTTVRLVVALLLVGVEVAVSAQGQPDAVRTAEPSPFAGISRAIDDLVASQLRTRRIAGAVVIAMHGDAVIHRRGYGLADVAKRRPMEASTIVRLAPG